MEKERQKSERQSNWKNEESRKPKGWIKPRVYAHIQVRARSFLLIQPGLPEWSFHDVEQRTRNDVDIDFTTDGLVLSLYLPYLSSFLLFFFETLSLACSIVVAAKEATTRSVSFLSRD